VSDTPLSPATPVMAPPAPAPEAPRVRRGVPPGTFIGTGRRKSAVARVRISAGDGKFLINNRPVEQYFTEPQDRNDATAPLQVTGTLGRWNVRVLVRGGGHTGQAGAVRLGLARALVEADRQHEPALRDAGYLTRDSRRVERKKYGRRKARRRFQFSKR